MEKKMNRIFNNYTTADYCPNTTTNSRINMNSTAAFEMPQDCFNIVKDYMGIVSVPTPVWNELMKIPLKDIKWIYRSIQYYKPFPKGTDLRKVSKKDKLQRYWCGAIKNEISLYINYFHSKLRSKKYEKELESVYLRKARIFHKICIDGDIEDGDTYVKSMPHLWGNFQATDFSIGICYMLMEEVYARLRIDKICLGCNEGEIWDSIRTYEKRNKFDYHN